MSWAFSRWRLTTQLQSKTKKSDTQHFDDLFSNKIIVPANTIRIRLTQSILLVCENVIVWVATASLFKVFLAVTQGLYGFWVRIDRRPICDLSAWGWGLPCEGRAGINPALRCQPVVRLGFSWRRSYSSDRRKNVATTEVYANISDAHKRASVGCITLKK